MMLSANPARRREAIDRLVALNEQYTGRAEYLAVLAAAYARAGRGPEAQVTLSRALALDPAQPVARALSGDPAALAAVKDDPFSALLF
jgi:Flp pilus assembly protein TadD